MYFSFCPFNHDLFHLFVDGYRIPVFIDIVLPECPACVGLHMSLLIDYYIVYCSVLREYALSHYVVRLDRAKSIISHYRDTVPLVIFC